MKQVIYGWKSTKGKQLFVYQNGVHWGVTYNPREAAKFHTIDECLDHWKSKQAFPQNYAHLIYEDHLQFFEAKSMQQILFMALPP